MDVVCPSCAAYHWTAEKIVSSPEHGPKFTACCQRGHVSLRLLSPSPPFLHQLLNSDDAEGKEFRSNIHQYNMALVFTSLGVKEDAIVNRWGIGSFVYLYHLIGSLCANEGEPPAYVQLYIYNSQLALAQRMKRNDNLSRNTMSALQAMLLDNHPYSTEFKHTFEVLREYPDVSDANIRLCIMPGQD